MMSNGGRCSWWSTVTATELGSEAKPHLQSCDESSGSACGSSITFQEVVPHSFIDSSISWTQALLNGEKPETFLSMLQDQELGSRSCIDKQESPMVSAMDHNFLFQQYSSSPGDESINHSSINPSSYGSWSKPLLSQEVTNQLQFIANNTSRSPWCNINTATGTDGNSIFHPPTLASSKTTTCGRKMISSVTHDACSSSSAKKIGGEQKRPRVEAASTSPLPPFKVRKEKLGDRVTALQQLVSPFGKTDTASVLQEAIDYIKFLHDQVGVLSSPYFKDGLPSKQKQVPNSVQMIKKPQSENLEASKQLADLRSLGLCLVPISGTYPVTGETAGDFWHPTATLFGGSFR